MTTPADLPIEDRVRAHLDEVAGRVELPGPEADAALARAREGLPLEVVPGDELAARRRRRARPLLAAAAVVAVVALVAGLALAQRDDGSGVRTDPTPPPPTPTTEPEPEVPPTTTETTPDTTTSTSQPAPPPGGAPTGPIVGPEGILGSWDGAAWVEWDGTSAGIAQRANYQVVTVGGDVRTVPGTTGTTFCVVSEHLTVDVGFEPAGPFDPLGVAVAGEVDVQPRPVEVLDPGAAVYQQAAQEIAAELGVDPQATQVGQVVRADLDGDGTAEVLVSAHRIADPQSLLADTGDWAAVFIRETEGSGVRTTVLASQVVAPEHVPVIDVPVIGAVADLNGDGRMEVVLHERYYEGSSTSVHEYRDGALTEVMSVGCGA